MVGDQVIREFLQRHPVGTIVNIGCGLDTTFERRTFIAASFLEQAWLDEIEIKENVLFMAANVFYYFKETVIKDLIIRLIDNFPRSEILFDVSSPVGVKVSNRKVVESAGLDERSHLVMNSECRKE